MTKCESGMSQFLKAVNEQAGTISNLEIINQLAAVLDKHREVGIQEAIYRILSLPMAKSSVKVKYLSTRHPHFRDGLLKGGIENLEEEESIFHLSPHEYYSNRLLDCVQGVEYTEEEMEDDYWKDLSFAEFQSWYDLVYVKKGLKTNPNKKHIPLKNEIGYIKRRKERCILRYYLNYENDEDFKRGLLILFFPFQDEMKDIHERDVDKLYLENESLVKDKRELFEKHKVMTDIIESIERQVEEKIEEDQDLEDDGYREEESTTMDELDDFEKWAKHQAKKSLQKYKDLTSLIKVEDLRNVIIKLNEQQRRIFDDFCERLHEDEGPPFYLYIAGEAGTGKSFLVKIMIEAIKHLKLTPGDDLRKPPALVMAPTASAAYIISGKTIESTLGMMPNRSNTFAKRKSSQVSNLSFLYEDVAVLFCDEISMVGSSKFTKMNFQMQDITGRNEFMGGLPFIAVGDFRQLPPVRDQFVYEKNHLDGRPSIAPSHWDDNFLIYYLTDKMRNQKDPEFASLCDRVGNGKITKSDLSYLNNCARDTKSEYENDNFKSGKVSIIVMTNKVRQEINEHKLNTLLKDRQLYISYAVDRCTNLENPPQIPSNLSITQTGGLENKIMLKKDAPIVITSNHPQAKYKEDGIVNGAKGFIDSLQLSKKEADKIEVVWVVFKDKSVGKLLRYELKNLKKLHKPSDENAVPILRQKKTFSIQNGEIKFQRFQFPLTLSYAITAYKCQGDTLEEVIIDFAHESGEIRGVPCGSFYVALTRVKEGANVYLKSFSEKYITVNKRVEQKIEAMRKYKPYRFKKHYISDQIFEDITDDLKLGYFNINGLLRSNHAEYLDCDINLLHLDCLVVSETWLNSDVSNADVINKLKHWKVLKRLDATDNIEHMGLLLLIPNTTTNTSNFMYSLDYIEGYKSKTKSILYQGLVIDLIPLYRRVAFLYLRATPTTEELYKLRESVKNCDCIIGDLNLNPKVPEQRKKLLTLCGASKYMALEEITTDIGNQLEHVILEKDLKKRCFSTAFLNFASDHKSIVVRIASAANNFTTEFKQQTSFDQDFHTKKKTQAADKVFKNTKKDDVRCATEIGESDTTRNQKENCLSILMFDNPSSTNLCFSNSVTSALLNIPVFQSILFKKTEEMSLYSKKNEIIRELIKLNKLSSLSKSSTLKLRSIVHSHCIDSDQITRCFNDYNQHDASEFLMSVFEHIFKDLTADNMIDEEIFGGLFQESLVCNCGNIKHLPIQKLSEVLMVQICGPSLQTCLDNFLGEEKIDLNCTKCKKREILKKFILVAEPSTLIIQLSRYKYEVREKRTIKRHEEIEVSKRLSLPSGSAYTISSIINHIGSTPDEGHYNVLIFDSINDSFVLLDDLNVCFDMQIKSDKSRLPYIVVYTKD